MSARSHVLALGLVVAYAAPAAAQDPVAEAMERAHAELAQVTAARDRVDAEREGVTEERDRARRRMTSRLRALYRMRRAGVLPLAGGFDALLSHQSRVQRLERMVVRDIGAVRALGRRAEAMDAEASRLAEEVQRSEQLVSQLEERDAARSRELSLLQSMMQDPSGYAGVDTFGGLRVSGGPAPSFLDERGRLPLPVAGSARIDDATREGGAGLALRAAEGVTVRSVYAGRVAFAAHHPAYERLVIVDHGDDHYTVYGGLGAVGVSVGHTVARDSVIGVVGTSPIFFQVRRGSRPLDARAWMGL